MLSQGIECRRQGVALLAALALGDVVPYARVVPPVVGRYPTVKGTDERHQGRDCCVEFVEEGRAGNGIVGAAAVQGDHGGRGIEVSSRPEEGSEAVRPCARLERELVGSGGGVDLRSEEARQDAGCQPAQGIPCGDSADTASGLLQGCEARKGQGREDGLGDGGVGEEGERMGEEGEALLVLQQQLVMLHCCAGETASSPALCRAEGVSDGGRREMDGRGRLECEQSIRDGPTRGWRPPRWVRQGAERRGRPGC